jgi:hypothetical protein
MGQPCEFQVHAERIETREFRMSLAMEIYRLAAGGGHLGVLRWWWPMCTSMYFWEELLRQVPAVMEGAAVGGHL